MDPRLFEPDAIDPETRALNERLLELAARHHHITHGTPEEARRRREEGDSIFGPPVRSDRAETWTIPGPGGDIPLRVFRHPDPAGVYLHIHGGGWVLGGPDHQDPRLEAIARRCSMAVVSVGYRLAPEHPYPAGPDDCEAAACWLVESAGERLGSDRLLIGGESAGAHLAVLTLLRLRERGIGGFLGANLTYGVYDLRLTPSARAWGGTPLALDTPSLVWFIRHFLADPGLAEDAAVSPILADLRGMPPALFTVGTLDPLLDDTQFLYQRWVAAGSPAGLAVYPGAPHAFDVFDAPVARVALDRVHAFLRATAGGLPA